MANDLLGLLETGATLGTGAVSGLLGMPYGLYKGITSGAYGTPLANRIAEEEARKFMERNTYQPRTQAGQENLQAIAGLLEKSKLPPVMPEAALLSAIPVQAYAAQAERAGMAAEKAIEPAVRRTMERGGLPAQLLGDLSQGSIRPMDVWHGSPHGPFTKFDPSKARTGEGNASYGEGAYLAQARGTGEEYRRALTGNHNNDQFIPTVDGNPVDTPVVRNLIRNGQSPEQFIASMQKKLENQTSALKTASKEDELGLGITDYDMAEMALGETKKLIDEAKGYIGKEIKAQSPGYLYKVDLPDEAIPKMIDWDKPIGQQSKEVRQAIERTKEMLPPNAIGDLGGDLSLLYGKDVTPEQFLNTWESFGKPAGGESALAKQGITGIRYLDQESRNAGQFSITPPTHTVSGKWMVKGTDYNSKGMHFDTEAEALAKLQEMNANQTSNFVVFPEYQDLLTIKEINDKPVGGLLGQSKAALTPVFETGKEVTFPFIKNTEKAPKMSGFGQDIEPAGNYILSGHDVDRSKLASGWTTGEISFKNPLVIDWGKSGLYTEPDNWKQVLSSQYGGKTGKALSKAIAKDGYDGIVTMTEYGPSEIVDLSMFPKKKQSLLD